MKYVLDASTLQTNCDALGVLEGVNVEIPISVIEALESKVNHSKFGYYARKALKDLRSTMDRGLVHIHVSTLSPLEMAEDLSASEDVTLVTQDLSIALRAEAAGVKTLTLPIKSLEPPPGVMYLDVSRTQIDSLYETGFLKVDESVDVNVSVVLKSGESSALGRMHSDGRIRLVKDRSLFDIRARSAEQRLAIDMLTDPALPLVSLAGRAGTGKSLLALAAALELTVNKRTFDKVLIFRPMHSVGRQDLGFLPGDAEEKMSPWTGAVLDTLSSFCGENVIEYIVGENILEVLPLTHLRGRTLNNSFIIFDEVQNYEASVVKTALTRIGEDSKAVMTYDVAQIDNPKAGAHDMASVVERLWGSELFGHITLSKSERSPIAELVSRLI